MIENLHKTKFSDKIVLNFSLKYKYNSLNFQWNNFSFSSTWEFDNDQKYHYKYENEEKSIMVKKIFNPRDLKQHNYSKKSPEKAVLFCKCPCKKNNFSKITCSSKSAFSDWHKFQLYRRIWSLNTKIRYMYWNAARNTLIVVAILELVVDSKCYLHCSKFSLRMKSKQ